MIRIGNDLRSRTIRKRSENIENLRNPPMLPLSSSPYSKTASLRFRQFSSRENFQQIAPQHLKLLYKAKCADLSIPVLPDQERRFFISCQSYFKNRRFQFKDMNLGPQSAKVIGKVVAMNPQFSYIILQKNIFGDSGALSLCKRLENSSHVVHLDISSNDITSEGSAKVISLLSSHKSISSLDISSHEGLHRNKLGLSSCSALSSLLQHNNLLSMLNIANTSIGNSGLALLTEGLAKNKVLLSLDLSSNGISENLQDFCSAVASSNLLKLELSNNKVGNEGCEDLAALFAGSLGNRCPLQMIGLANNLITVKGLVKLFGALRLNSWLEELVLDNNHFEQGLSSEFVSFMQGNKGLLKLSLKKSGLTDEKSNEFYEGLSVNTVLQSLNLMGNFIGNDGARCIALGLSKNKVLKNLNLASNKIKTQGGISLANSLRINKALEKLNLRDNKFDNIIGEQFLEVSRGNLNVLSIKLDDNLIDIKYLQNIDSCLKRNNKHRMDSIIPQLKTNIKTLNETKNNEINSNLRLKLREKREMQMKLSRQVHRFEDIKTKEESKTEVLVKERQEIHQIYLEKSQSLLQIEEEIKLRHAQYGRDVSDWTDKIYLVAYKNRNLEKNRAKTKEKNYMKRSYSNKCIDDLKETLHREEIALKTSRNLLESLHEKLCAKKAQIELTHCRTKNTKNCSK